VNSIVLSHEDYEKFQTEWMDSLYEGDRPITKRVEEAGVDVNGFSGLYIENKPYGVIVSRGRVQEPKTFVSYLELTPEQRASAAKALLKEIERNPVILFESEEVEFIEPDVNKTEVMNIFNELLGEWYESEECLIGHTSGSMEEDLERLNEDKERCKRRFTEALGVPYEKGE
jgi:hypothetical protein